MNKFSNVTLNFILQISRLIDIPVPNSVNDSFVEINGPNGWGFICVDYLNLKSANVICRSSRHQFAANIRSSSLSEAVVRYGGIIECSGSERSISDCGVSLMQTDSCPNGEAILVCRTGKYHISLIHIITYTNSRLKCY